MTKTKKENRLACAVQEEEIDNVDKYDKRTWRKGPFGCELYGEEK